MSYVVGLTGGIGCGKSTVSQLFAELGIPVIDTDEISRNLTGTYGQAIPEISRVFGSAYISATGGLDRQRMRELVFNDTKAKTTLETILHPLILAEVIQKLNQYNDSAYVLLVVPLLIESQNYLNIVHRVLVVDCVVEQQIKRTMNRSGLSEDDVQRIIDQQCSREQRLQQADDVILNQGSLANLQVAVAELHQFYLNRVQSLLTTDKHLPTQS